VPEYLLSLLPDVSAADIEAERRFLRGHRDALCEG
jgi:hypothetical protein